MAGMLLDEGMDFQIFQVPGRHVTEFVFEELKVDVAIRNIHPPVPPICHSQVPDQGFAGAVGLG